MQTSSFAFYIPTRIIPINAHLSFYCSLSSCIAKRMFLVCDVCRVALSVDTCVSTNHSAYLGVAWINLSTQLCNFRQLKIYATSGLLFFALTRLEIRLSRLLSWCLFVAKAQVYSFLSSLCRVATQGINYFPLRCCLDIVIDYHACLVSWSCCRLLSADLCRWGFLQVQLGNFHWCSNEKDLDPASGYAKPSLEFRSGDSQNNAMHASPKYYFIFALFRLTTKQASGFSKTYIFLWLEQTKIWNCIPWGLTHGGHHAHTVCFKKSFSGLVAERLI